MVLKHITVILTLVVLISGCSEDGNSMLDEMNSEFSPDEMVISLSTEIIPLINRECAVPGCHVTGD